MRPMTANSVTNSLDNCRHGCDFDMMPDGKEVKAEKIVDAEARENREKRIGI